MPLINKKQPARFIEAERVLWAKYGVTPSQRRVTLPDGNEVRVQELGEGPPVVFVHGAAVAGTSWILLAHRLMDEFRCILVDRPGCGLSDPVPNGPLRSPAEFKRFADDFAPHLLDALELDSAALVCTSMGGYFGFRAAIARPHRITRLVEYSWAMGTPMAHVPTMMRLGSTRPLRALMPRMPITRSTVKTMLKQVGLERAVESGTFDDDMIDWVVANLRHTDTLRSETANNIFISIRGENSGLLFTDAELARVQMPVLLLWGIEDPNGGRREAEAFADRLPNATLDVIERAGHAPWIDRIDSCVQPTRAFLRLEHRPPPTGDPTAPT